MWTCSLHETRDIPQCADVLILFSFLVQSVAPDPFASSFGGMGFSDDPFKSKSDTPALPPKKNVPPRPKPPSGKEVFFAVIASSPDFLYVIWHKDKLTVFYPAILYSNHGGRHEIISRWQNLSINQTGLLRLEMGWLGVPQQICESVCGREIGKKHSFFSK